MKKLFSYYKVLLIAVMAMGMVATFSDGIASADHVAGDGVECDASTGHCYQWVPTQTDWYVAKAAAEGMTHNGVQGHLATITSDAETDFIVDKFPTATGVDAPAGGWAYFGGYRLVVDDSDLNNVAWGDWKWVTGETFGSYEKFAGSEPSGKWWDGDGNRSVLGFFHNQGRTATNPGVNSWNPAWSLGWDGFWNDASPATGYGYVVEFDAPPTPQSATFLGGVGTPGTVMAGVEASFNGDAASPTWQPAYNARKALTGSQTIGDPHPWGLVDGTTQWISVCTTLDDSVCIDPDNVDDADNKFIWYKIQFDVPADWFGVTMDFTTIVDNAATVFLNGAQIGVEYTGSGSVSQSLADGTLQAGTNNIIVLMEDWGGLSGINYRIDLNGLSSAPIVVTGDADTDGVPDGIDPAPNDPCIPNAGPDCNAAPTTDAGDDATEEATSASGAIVGLDGSDSDDPDGDELTYGWSAVPSVTFINPTSATPSATFPIGTTVVTLTVEDPSGETATDTVSITVEDTTDPVLVASVVLGTLWSPNHKMVDVGFAYSAVDAVSAVTVEITVTSDEDSNGKGDGNTSDNYEVDGTTVLLRAERDGRGDARTYTITIVATDATGNSSTAFVEVSVPKSKGKKK